MSTLIGCILYEYCNKDIGDLCNPLFRENERHRHHGLNASIREISRRIPGYDENGKETKIIKLQRIISYICHMEDEIMGLCDELGIALDFKNLFLSPHTSHVTEQTKRASPKTQTKLAKKIDLDVSYRNNS